jgi:hypothetical protein
MKSAKTFQRLKVRNAGGTSQGNVLMQTCFQSSTFGLALAWAAPSQVINSVILIFSRILECSNSICITIQKHRKYLSLHCSVLHQILLVSEKPANH